MYKRLGRGYKPRPALGNKPRAAEKLMSRPENDNDELRPEYDLNSLRIRKIGAGRLAFGPVVRLEPDVAEVFPDSSSVNEALRFLMRITKENSVGP